MASLTLKGVPDDLLTRLKREAAEHRRSLNGEVLYRLERSVADPVTGGGGAAGPYRKDLDGRALTIAERRDIDADEWLRRVREVRDRLDIHTSTEEIIAARDYGRK